MTALTRVTFPELPTPHGRRERCYHDCPSASPGGADQLDVKFYYLCWKHSGTICIVPQVDFLKSWLCLKNTPFQLSSVTLTRYSSVFTQPLLTIYLLIHLRQKSQQLGIPDGAIQRDQWEYPSGTIFDLPSPQTWYNRQREAGFEQVVIHYHER
jgi:hypothetical protein